MAKFFEFMPVLGILLALATVSTFGFGWQRKFGNWIKDQVNKELERRR